MLGRHWNCVSIMTDSKNKIAAQLLKAEMLGDHAKVENLKRELLRLSSETASCQSPRNQSAQNNHHQDAPTRSHHRKETHQDQRVKKFVKSNPSLNMMFVGEKNITAKDEARMFFKTSLKFAKDDMETKFFSEEIDDSQAILNKSKRHKPDSDREDASHSARQDSKDEYCDRCFDKCPRHLVVHETNDIYVCLMSTKPFMAEMTNVIIRNKKHSIPSLVSASSSQKHEVDRLIGTLRRLWSTKGYRLIAMETYFKTRRPMSGKQVEIASCGHHFQVHCIPIRDKHYERARMGFKQALSESGREWSMNKKVITTQGRKIYRCLPDGLSHFWICFDSTSNGFGHIIEDDDNFSRYFGFEVLSDLFPKDFSISHLSQKEDYMTQFERSRNFKLIYSEFKNTEDEPE